MVNTFFLTGCASGVGRHLCQALQQRGDRVFATDINVAALEAAAGELDWPADRVKLHGMNVVDYAGWEAAFSRAEAELGPVDVLMNIAGLLLASWTHETPLNEIDSQVDVNVRGVMYGTRVAAERMVARGSGHIINIASIAGTVPVPGMGVYCATKYAVRAYSLVAAMELREKGVYVTVVCPSTIDTPMLAGQVDNTAAEIFFSGHKILTLADVEHAILHRVLPHKPYEIHLPRGKTLVARCVDIFPRLGPVFAPLYRRSGRKRQETRRQQGV